MQMGTAAFAAAQPVNPTKWKRVLAALLAGRSFNRFESERELNDHVLPQTIAKLQEKGLLIRRRDETVLGFQGIETHVTRYWLAEESKPLAGELLGVSAETKQPRAVPRIDQRESTTGGAA